MGRTYSTLCLNCGKTEEFMLGVGFMTPNNIDDIILNNKSEKENEFLRYVTENRNAKLADNLGFRLYECPVCETLHSKFHVEITYNRNDLFIKKYNCNKCKAILVPLPKKIDLSKFACKNCGEKALQESLNYTMWD